MEPLIANILNLKWNLHNLSSKPCENWIFTVLILAIFNAFPKVTTYPTYPTEADHITAMSGDSLVFNCEVNFPNDQPVPYVVQWWKKDRDLPIYIWYDDYPTHAATEYAGRVSRAESISNVKFGLASLNLTNIRNEDRGWYNCKVLFLDRSPEVTANDTWYHLDVHSRPHFTQKPDDILYVSAGDTINLRCQAVGIPLPSIKWYRGHSEIMSSKNVAVVNEGSDIRISHVKSSDLGSYMCVAKNTEGNITHITKLVQAGGAVITNPPTDQTVLEHSEVAFKCEAVANPRNISVTWFKGNVPLKSIDEGGLSERSTVRSDGSLIISSVQASDRGSYACQATNGLGQPVSAAANLIVHFPARVSFMETVQYIPRGLQGMINCYIEAEPPTDFVTWKKNQKIFDPFDTPGVVALSNGSLLIDKVGNEHAGDYICIPYNREGSKGPSDTIQVIIKDPPEFITKPDQEYVKDVGGKVSMPCKALGSPRPVTKWRRIDGQPLPRHRSHEHNGELTIDSLRQSDHGVYECVVESTVATLVARTTLVIEMTTPHAPRNISVTNSETYAMTVEWMPGYSGCVDCQQTYKIRYREKDSKFPNWLELPVNPPNARKIEIHNLAANTKYEFQVMGINQYGDGMFSEIIEASTRGDGIDFAIYPPPTGSPVEKSTFPDCRSNASSESGAQRKLLSSECIEFNVEVRPHSDSKTTSPLSDPRGEGPEDERPHPATNLTLTQEAGGYVLRWQGPLDPTNLLYYTVEIKKDGQGEKWRPLTDHRIDTEEASYMMKNMGTAKAYWFRVFSHSATAYSISEQFKYDLPENVKRRAVTAGLIGGVLFFIVAIILSVCTVKICNKQGKS